MRFHLLYILIPALLWGCKKNDEAPPVEGIVFSPVTAYQEAYPGTVVSFRFRVASQQALTSFGVRFKLPGETDFKSLPQYPDQTTNANTYTSFSMFEYALPPSATDIDADVQVKFVAAAGSKTYEKIYTIKVKKSGLQNIKVYSPFAATMFNFPAVDLVRATGVPEDADAASQDLLTTALERTFPLEGITFNVLHGFISGNDTRFKLVTAANYNGDVANYGNIYNGIAAERELKGASSLRPDPLEAIGVLVGGQFYIAKVVRGANTSYIALSVKRAPAITSGNAGTITAVDMTNEFLQLEIKK